MALAGPMTIFRWPGGAQPRRESLGFDKALPTVLDLPIGVGQNAGKDQAEGITLFAPDGGEARAVLVVYDSAASSRQRETSTVETDLFALPPPAVCRTT